MGMGASGGGALVKERVGEKGKNPPSSSTRHREGGPHGSRGRRIVWLDRWLCVFSNCTWDSRGEYSSWLCTVGVCPCRQVKSGACWSRQTTRRNEPRRRRRRRRRDPQTSRRRRPRLRLCGYVGVWHCEGMHMSALGEWGQTKSLPVGAKLGAHIDWTRRAAQPEQGVRTCVYPRVAWAAPRCLKRNHGGAQRNVCPSDTSILVGDWERRRQSCTPCRVATRL